MQSSWAESRTPFISLWRELKFKVPESLKSKLKPGATSPSAIFKDFATDIVVSFSLWQEWIVIVLINAAEHKTWNPPTPRIRKGCEKTYILPIKLQFTRTNINYGFLSTKAQLTSWTYFTKCFTSNEKYCSVQWFSGASEKSKNAHLYICRPTGIPP